MFKSIILAFAFFVGALYGWLLYFIVASLNWVYSTFIELHTEIKKAALEGMDYVFTKSLE